MRVFSVHHSFELTLLKFFGIIEGEREREPASIDLGFQIQHHLRQCRQRMNRYESITLFGFSSFFLTFLLNRLKDFKDVWRIFEWKTTVTVAGHLSGSGRQGEVWFGYHSLYAGGGAAAGAMLAGFLCQSM